MENKKKYLTVTAIARRFDVSRPTVRALVDEGKLPALRFSPRKILIAEDALDEYIEKRSTYSKE